MIASIFFAGAQIASLILIGVALVTEDWPLGAMGATLSVIAGLAQWISRRA